MSALYPTYLEFQCLDHPELGWLPDHAGHESTWGGFTAWERHRGVAHERIGQYQARSRKRPFTRHMEQRTQFIGYRPDMPALLEMARQGVIV